MRPKMRPPFVRNKSGIIRLIFGMWFWNQGGRKVIFLIDLRWTCLFSSPSPLRLSLFKTVIASGSTAKSNFLSIWVRWQLTRAGIQFFIYPFYSRKKAFGKGWAWTRVFFACQWPQNHRTMMLSTNHWRQILLCLLHYYSVKENHGYLAKSTWMVSNKFFHITFLGSVMHQKASCFLQLNSSLTKIILGKIGAIRAWTQRLRGWYAHAVLLMSATKGWALIYILSFLIIIVISNKYLGKVHECSFRFWAN